MSFQIKNCEITLLQEKIEKETETETDTQTILSTVQ